MMFRLENGSALYFLVLTLGLYGLAIFRQAQANQIIKKLFNAVMQSKILGNLDLSKRKWKWFLRATSLVFMTLALARPQLGQNETKVMSEGFEILLAVDVSESMMAEDLKPNRLEQLKLEMARLIDLMPGNKVGIIAFAGSSALLAPLTNDMGAVKMYLDSLSPSLISNQGTNVETAIKHAIEVLEKGGTNAQGVSKATRVILIASDGEDHEEKALEAVDEAVQKGIRVYTVAYGTEKGATIPVRDNFGYLKGEKKDQNGQTVITQVKGDFLKSLAQRGKGSFYFSIFGGEHLGKLIDDFKEFEKSEFESKVITDYEERFQIFLLVGFLLALIEIFIGERKLVQKIWRGRYVPQK